MRSDTRDNPNIMQFAMNFDKPKWSDKVPCMIKYR